MAERLQKILSQWGIASRRQAEQMILDGRVRLNGAIGQIGQKAEPETDCIEVDGQRLSVRPRSLYLLLNKPAGVVSTCDDPQGRLTVLQLLPDSLTQQTGLHPVGRLDTASTGALLLTNDGAVTACFTHPRHEVVKTYQVWVEGSPPESVLQQWRQGVSLEGRLTLPADVKVLDKVLDSEALDSEERQKISQSVRTCLEIKLREGRNRQIRRVAQQLGYPVVSLHRVAIGSLTLEGLPSSHYRLLRDAEVEFVQSSARLHLPSELSVRLSSV